MSEYERFEKHVPSLQSCKRLRETDFQDSLFVWRDTGVRRMAGEEAPIVLHVYELDLRMPDQASRGHYYPAPMPQEIQEDLLGYGDVRTLLTEATLDEHECAQWTATLVIENVDTDPQSRRSLAAAWLYQWFTVNFRPDPED